MTRTTARRARRARSCGACRRPIPVGTVYLEHVASPWHDILSNETWWKANECARCAARYGRARVVAARRVRA